LGKLWNEKGAGALPAALRRKPPPFNRFAKQPESLVFLFYYTNTCLSIPFSNFPCGNQTVCVAGKGKPVQICLP
jgi:hypothetical protein